MTQPWGWRPQKFFHGEQRRYFAYNFQVADDAMQMDLHKTLYPFHTTKKMTHVSVTITEMRFVGSETQEPGILR